MTQFFLAATLGVLFSISTYLVLRRDVVRVAWDVSIIDQLASIYLIAIGGLDGLAPTLSGHNASGPVPLDPIVQALVLTTIVIGLRTAAFALVLAYRVHEEHETINMYELGRSR